MERTASPTSPPPPDARELPDMREPSGVGEPPGGSGFLDGIPAQRTPPCVRPPVGTGAGPRPRRRIPLPVPVPVPFTLGYAAVLAVTSYLAEHLDPALVYTLLQGSSTDVAHLVQTPAAVLAASALWVAGGLASPFTLAFLVVLTALERRVGGARTAVVFLLGHVLATLATEVPVGLAVLAGRLPDSSLHRLDYGISFGVAGCVGALAGLLRPWLRWPVLAAFGAMLLQDLLAFTDPMTDWGHLIALTIGVAAWPWVRRWDRARPAAASAA
ncbi:rhomboid-like protein [Streptomyces sp. NPDC000658]|uniref:rhomboid-like protein n=1 Tax=Streptomyces sp. NPDC000658 TaxID=3154266 RepID=UPI00332911D4